MSNEKYGKLYWDEGKGSNYGGDSPEYNVANYLPAKVQVASKVIQMIGIPKNSMSVGCGRGFQVMAFRQLGIDAKGLDKSEYAVETAPEEIKEHLTVVDLSDNVQMMKMVGGQYELVTAFDVLEHIKVPGLYNAIMNTIRLSNRFVMINIPVKNITDEPDESETSTDSTHVSIYRPDWWINQFLQIGTPYRLELRHVSINHTEHTYTMFALFEKYGEY